VSRRGVTLGATALLALLVPGAPAAHAAAPTATPIKHLVVLLQENHTFDNYFGSYPGADGRPRDVCMPVDPSRPGKGCVRPFHIGSNAIEPFDPDHSQGTFRLQYDRGKLDGFVHALDVRNQDGALAMGYYDRADLPFYWNLAGRYVLYDHFFSSARGGSFINHMYWVAGRPAATGDRMPTGHGLQLPTIFDRLQQKGVSWKFYVQNYDPNLNYRNVASAPPNRASQVTWVPLLNYDRFIDDPALRSHIVDLRQYYVDLAHGTLPAVSYIVPSGPSEHPPSSVLSGQVFVRGLITTLMESSAWKSSAFLLAYDDWGGWYDHVVPPRVDKGGYGFRVPAILVSPYARRGVVDHTQLDLTSILKFIEQNWGVPPLASRDRNARSIASGFDFSARPRRPAIVPFSGGTAPPPKSVARTIYAAYGLVALLAVAAVMRAVVRTRTRRRAVKAT
jgi:phospholipase C